MKIRNLVVLAISFTIIVLILVFTYSCGRRNSSDPIEFADRVFRNSLAIALGVDSSKPIYPEDLKDYRSVIIVADRVMLYKQGEQEKSVIYFGDDVFEIEGKKYQEEGTMESLADLVHFPAMINLKISFQRNADFDTIELSSEDVYIVYFHENDLEDISFISQFKNLKYLTTVYDSFTNLDPLKDLSKLKWISVNNSRLNDISAITNLTELERIDFSHNDISDISSVSELKTLKHINLSHNNIADISALSGLTDLEYLYLSDNEIQDVSPILNFDKLKRLFVSGNPVTNMDVLDKLKDIMD